MFLLLLFVQLGQLAVLVIVAIAAAPIAAVAARAVAVVHGLQRAENDEEKEEAREAENGDAPTYHHPRRRVEVGGRARSDEAESLKLCERAFALDALSVVGTVAGQAGVMAGQAIVDDVVFGDVGSQVFPI